MTRLILDEKRGMLTVLSNYKDVDELEENLVLTALLPFACVKAQVKPSSIREIVTVNIQSATSKPNVSKYTRF